MPELTAVAFGHSRAPSLTDQAATWLSLVMPAAIVPGIVVDFWLADSATRNPEVREGEMRLPISKNISSLDDSVQAIQRVFYRSQWLRSQRQ